MWSSASGSVMWRNPSWAKVASSDMVEPQRARESSTALTAAGCVGCQWGLIASAVM